MGKRWTGLWFSSINGDAALSVIPFIYPVGPGLTVSAAGAAADHTSYLSITGAAQFSGALWIAPTAGYSLIWGADLAPDCPPEAVPEPGTLTLLGLGLTAGVARLRARRPW